MRVSRVHVIIFVAVLFVANVWRYQLYFLARKTGGQGAKKPKREGLAAVVDEPDVETFSGASAGPPSADSLSMMALARDLSIQSYDTLVERANPEHADKLLAWDPARPPVPCKRYTSSHLCKADHHFCVWDSEKCHDKATLSATGNAPDLSDEPSTGSKKKSRQKAKRERGGQSEKPTAVAATRAAPPPPPPPLIPLIEHDSHVQHADGGLSSPALPPSSSPQPRPPPPISPPPPPQKQLENVHNNVDVAGVSSSASCWDPLYSALPVAQTCDSSTGLLSKRQKDGVFLKDGGWQPATTEGYVTWSMAAASNDDALLPRSSVSVSVRDMMPGQWAPSKGVKHHVFAMHSRAGGAKTAATIGEARARSQPAYWAVKVGREYVKSGNLAGLKFVWAGAGPKSRREFRVDPWQWTDGTRLRWSVRWNETHVSFFMARTNGAKLAPVVRDAPFGPRSEPLAHLWVGRDPDTPGFAGPVFYNLRANVSERASPGTDQGSAGQPLRRSPDDLLRQLQANKPNEDSSLPTDTAPTGGLSGRLTHIEAQIAQLENV